ncbi:MAG TPA: hypothetical protein VFV07_02095 [Rhizomicrobium sp.]|nr:hypothetical protein [Rhizomicrobium sp.]
MSEDDIAKIVSIALLAAHLGVGIWRRQWIAPLNLLVSAGVTAFWAFNIHELMGDVAAVWVWAFLETVILAISALAVAGRRMPVAVLWISFGVHVAVTALFAIFMFTFKMERMM